MVMQPSWLKRLANWTGRSIVLIARSLYSWQWTKAFVYWLILSAGTASDLVFLMASFWMSVNSNVHELILHYMNEDTSKYITYLATTAYVALPIFIVGLAVVQTVDHIKMWKIGGFWSKVWAITFGIPAVIFLVMDFVTISCSVVNVTFTMPGVFVVLRADSAFIFAFGSLIFFFLGKPQERERLAEKDRLIASLRVEKGAIAQRMAEEKEQIIAAFVDEKRTILAGALQEKESLLAKIDVQNDEIESLKGILAETQKGFTELHKAVQKSSESALQGYSEECLEWLNSGVKSVYVDDIMRYTGHPKRRINRAILSGLLQTTPRNKDLILVSSLLEWLKQTPVKTGDTDPELSAIGE